MKRFSLLLCMAFATAMLAMAGGRDSYTVLISLDGFRWDYLEAYDCPFLNSLGEKGVKAVMQPSFPSKTFPNHYTLATGLVPDHHGIIANKFKIAGANVIYSLKDSVVRTNPAYYGGDPLWLTARRQGVTSATVYWVGSDVAVKGEHANYWWNYLDKLLTFEQRIDEVIRLLQLPPDKRPHLIMSYFEEPDASGHDFGPVARPTRQAMERMDSLMSVLWTRIQALPQAADVNFIVTGDHGMAWCNHQRQVFPKHYLKPEWVDTICNDFPALIYARAPQYIDSIYNALNGVDHLRVWKRGELPAYLNYGTNPNMGDVVVLADVGWVFDNTPWTDGGTHGYDNTASDMWVGFRAAGPDFKQGYTRPDTFRNVCIYPLVCHLLGITPSPCDGTLDEVRDLLRETPAP